ncbi:MAG: S24 family peptidase [Sutterella wadsworthensis]|nr:S24 family peptidase [Sutterella wadsworthensis]
MLVFTIIEDSIKPLLCTGDLVTVNTADTELADGKVYAFTYLGKLYIRKLRDLLDGGILVVSDNPTFPAEKINAPDTKHFRIIGRVIDRSGAGTL